VNKLKQSKVNKEDNSNNKNNDKSTSEDKSRKTAKRGSWKPKNQPAWMFISPKEGEKHEKTVNSKKYQWCSKHEAWVRHLPSKCRGKSFHPGNRQVRFADDEQSDQQPGEKPKSPRSKKLKVAKALASILKEDSF